MTLLVALLSARSACAQNGADIAARTGLLDHAQAASARGEHTEALDFAMRALALRRSLSVTRFIAEEHQALGHFADALGFAQECVRDVDTEPRTANRDRIVAGCQDIVRALTPRVGYLTVELPRPAPSGLQVRVQGRSLAEALWGVETVVTPGTVTVEVTATAYDLFSTQTSVAAGDHGRVTVTLVPGTSATASASGPSPSSPRTAAAQGSGVQSSSTPVAQTGNPPPPSSSSRMRLALGVGALALGAVFAGGGGAIEAISSTQYASCIQSGCSQGQQSNIQSLDAIATAGVYAGGVFVVAGAALLIWAVITPHADARTMRVHRSVARRRRLPEAFLAHETAPAASTPRHRAAMRTTAMLRTWLSHAAGCERCRRRGHPDGRRGHD